MFVLKAKDLLTPLTKQLIS